MLLFTVALMAASLPAATAPQTRSSKECRRTTSYLADQTGAYRGQPLTPKKLTELPPAVTYMAVYRHIGWCEAPLTMIEYRQGGRR